MFHNLGQRSLCIHSHKHDKKVVDTSMESTTSQTIIIPTLFRLNTCMDSPCDAEVDPVLEQNP